MVDTMRITPEPLSDAQVNALESANRAWFHAGAIGSVTWRDVQALIDEVRRQRQELADWQDHLNRVHRVACDYPYHLAMTEDDS